MKIELDNFIIEYDKEISYMPNIISTLENNTIEILDFFELEKLSKKKRVVIYTDREKYRKHLLPFVKEFKEWMCADTYDGNINLLEISESRKSKEHEDMDLDEFVKCILHEFVHSCQQEWNANSNGTSWYWEALATNLGNKEKFIEMPINATYEEINNFNLLDNNYLISYTIGRYLLENLSHKKILEYVKYPSHLQKNSKKIINNAIEWSKNF